MDCLGFFKIHAINLRLFDFSGHTLFFKINFKISCYPSRSSLGLFGSQFFTWEGNRWEEECLGKVGHLGSLEAFNGTSWKSVTHPVVHAVENIGSFRNICTFISLEISGYIMPNISSKISRYHAAHWYLPPESVTRCQTRPFRPLWGSSLF